MWIELICSMALGILLFTAGYLTGGFERKSLKDELTRLTDRDSKGRFVKK